MQRSSLMALVVVAAAACAPMGEEGTAHDTDVSASEEALVLSSATRTSSTVVPSTQDSSATLSKSSASSLLLRAPENTPDACSAYDGYTAALASRTVDCLGTIGPESFAVDGNGNLARRFSECSVDKEALVDIDALLSLQLRTKELPAVQRCMAGAWQAWYKQFVASGIQVCPDWKKVETINAPTAAGIEEYSKNLPPLPDKEGTRPPPIPHENYIVQLRFPFEPPAQRCKDPADCAQQCSGGFRGFWIEGSGDKAIVDPTYWLITTEYTNNNPFTKPGYYHPMSYAGAVPGALYGHRARAGELCSRQLSNVHYLFTLHLDCIDPSNPASCVSRCDEAPVALNGGGSDTSY